MECKRGVGLSGKTVLRLQEMRVLGRGAYGLAVAVINRLDGRQYAVKKIRLQRQVPSEYSRITREVATLSRLQHTNIVRYFQVGCTSCRRQETRHGLL